MEKRWGLLTEWEELCRSGRRKKGNKCDQNVLYTCMCEFELITKGKREQTHSSNLRY